MNNDHHLCISFITVSDFIFLRTRVHVEGIFATDAAKDFITPVTHHAALPMQP